MISLVMNRHCRHYIKKKKSLIIGLKKINIKREKKIIKNKIRTIVIQKHKKNLKLRLIPIYHHYTIIITVNQLS